MQFKLFIAVVFATIAALAPVEVIARPEPNKNPEFTSYDIGQSRNGNIPVDQGLAAGGPGGA